ncbi:MAG TPA: hypothetical protein VGC88_03340 [Terriglobales bacterium]|jgi:hypothetical protein
MLLKRLALIVGATGLLAIPAIAEQCSTPTELSAADKSAIDQAVGRFNQSVIAGDANGLKANAIPAVAGAFDQIAGTIQQMQTQVAGAHSDVTFEYLLTQDNKDTVDAKFYCGTFDPGKVANSQEVRVSFEIPKLPPGQYAFAISEVTGGRTPYKISYVLQQEGGQWKLAGFYPKPAQAAGHDGVWFWKQARDFKAKGQTHDAWFYLTTAQDLLQPVGFIDTTNLDKLFQEQSQIQPPDVPVDKPVTFTSSDGKSFTLNQMFTTTDDKGNLVLVVKYAVPDISNTGAAFQQNQALASALVQKYPEFKQAFASLVPRATAPTGQDFGSEFKMSDLK